MEINVDITSSHGAERLKAMQALMLVMDPELGINIVDMGLVYALSFYVPNQVDVKMTLSSSHCPMGDSIVMGVKRGLQQVFPDWVVCVELVWEPAWSPDRMSDEAKRLLGSTS